MSVMKSKTDRTVATGPSQECRPHVRQPCQTETSPPQSRHTATTAGRFSARDAPDQRRSRGEPSTRSPNGLLPLASPACGRRSFPRSLGESAPPPPIRRPESRSDPPGFPPHLEGSGRQRTPPRRSCPCGGRHARVRAKASLAALSGTLRGTAKVRVVGRVR